MFGDSMGDGHQDDGDSAFDTIVVKIMPRADWERACKSGAYHGSPDDLRDGFIHLSALDQVAGTLDKHYSGQTDLVALTYRAGDLGDALRWEVSRGGARFPHLYGPLPTAAAQSTLPLTTGADGKVLVPEALRA